MRRASQDYGWQLRENETAQWWAFGLGYDGCYEHEQGTPWLNRALGISALETPAKVSDFQMTQVPENLRLYEYTVPDCTGRPRTLTSKTKWKPKGLIPTALLVCGRSLPSEDGKEEAKHSDATFWGDYNTKESFHEKSNVVSSWSSDGGFAIHVRGQENVDRLKELHQAFLNKDVAVGLGVSLGFRRSGPSLVRVSSLTEEEHKAVESSLADHARLMADVKKSGIEELLRAAGKGWYALSPRWADHKNEKDLEFFLNPMEQRKYAFGYFTVDELQQWAKEEGPVVDHNAINERLSAEDKDWHYHLIRGLESVGTKLKKHPHGVWVDAEKTTVGLTIALHTVGEAGISSGIVPWSDISKFVDIGRQLRKDELALRKEAELAA